MSQGKRVDLLRDQRLLNKLCKKINKDFDCKDAFGCGLSCPLWIANEGQLLMNTKDLELGEAYRLTVRESISPHDAQKILQEHTQEKKPYPGVIASVGKTFGSVSVDKVMINSMTMEELGERVMVEINKLYFRLMETIRTIKEQEDGNSD